MPRQYGCCSCVVGPEDEEDGGASTDGCHRPSQSSGDHPTDQPMGGEPGEAIYRTVPLPLLQRLPARHRAAQPKGERS